MKFLIKQRVFSWSDTFDIYDEYENKKYFVQAEFLSLGHRLHVYDMNGHEVGLIKEKVLTFLPEFEVMIGGHSCGIIKKKFTFFTLSMNLIIMAGIWKEISFPGIMMYMKPVVRLYILQRNLYIGEIRM